MKKKNQGTVNAASILAGSKPEEEFIIGSLHGLCVVRGSFFFPALQQAMKFSKLSILYEDGWHHIGVFGIMRHGVEGNQYIGLLAGILDCMRHFGRKHESVCLLHGYVDLSEFVIFPETNQCRPQHGDRFRT
jgi:hypothetical protein